MLSRRDLIGGALGAAGALMLPRALRRDGAAHAAAQWQSATSLLDPLDIALRAQRWINSARVVTGNGVAWPADPLVPGTIPRNLYTGTPGVVLFLLELHHVTGERRFFEEAMRGADDLIASLPAFGQQSDAGLYTGVAGVAFTLSEVARASSEQRYRDAAVRATEYVMRAMDPAGGGTAYQNSSDIISGAAGVALYLLHAQKALRSDSIDVARRLAQHLVSIGQPANGGLKWAIAPRSTTLYPNFSHGAAGVSYALATVHETTRDQALLDAALAGARYLDAVTDRSAGCKVFHHEPDGEQLFYLSWCHGPAGTARLHRRLAQLTGEKRWHDAISCGAQATLAMGAPEQRTPGYWNNISQCCGSAGVGEFFLALHSTDPNANHLAVAERAAEDIVARGTDADGGMRWVQAEHRVRPEQLIAQTGLMQGAAGVGLFMLRLHAARTGKQPFVKLSDTPFA